MPIQDMEGLEHKPIPVIFLIDVSSSMAGLGIQQVNINLKEYVDALKIDPETKDAVQLSIVTFSDSADTVMKFEPVTKAVAPNLTTQSSTNLASGLAEVMRVVQEKADFIKAKCKRPLLVFMSDGNATCPERMRGNEAGWRDEIDRMNSDFIMKRAVRVALGAGNGIKDSTLEAFKLNETDAAVRIASMKDLSEFFKYIHTITKELSAGKQPSKPIGTATAGSVVLIQSS
ncbi:MAG TPA: VWA domain-containing protein [Blastocatellia bacterium]|nr:VWA domain-containing protein [Blastocatellia bacterium]